MTDQEHDENKSKTRGYWSPEWCAVYIAILALTISCSSAYYQYAADKHAKQKYTDNVLMQFETRAYRHQTAFRCFEYAMSLPEEKILEIFQDMEEPVNIEGTDISKLKRCIEWEDKEVGYALTPQLAFRFREKIFRAINNYEYAFLAIESGRVNRGPVCKTVTSTFTNHVKPFIDKVKSMSSTPEKFQDAEDELAPWTFALDEYCD